MVETKFSLTIDTKADPCNASSLASEFFRQALNLKEHQMFDFDGQK